MFQCRRRTRLWLQPCTPNTPRIPTTSNQSIDFIKCIIHYIFKVITCKQNTQRIPTTSKQSIFFHPDHIIFLLYIDYMQTKHAVHPHYNKPKVFENLHKCKIQDLMHNYDVTIIWPKYWHDGQIKIAITKRSDRSTNFGIHHFAGAVFYDTRSGFVRDRSTVFHDDLCHYFGECTIIHFWTFHPLRM